MSRMRDDEYIPDREVIEAIIRDAVGPTIDELESDIGEPLPTRVTFLARTLEGPHVLIAPKDLGVSPDHRGEVRVRCRPTFRSGRSLFLAEAIYRGVAPQTGFSGFKIDGEILEENGTITVKPKGLVIQYNVWEWEVKESEGFARPW